jgi:hypothetical protein
MIEREFQQLILTSSSGMFFRTIQHSAHCAAQSHDSLYRVTTQSLSDHEDFICLSQNVS